MPPLFILAPPRSFTSVVCAALGCHPQMYGLPEINLFAAETMVQMQELYFNRAHRRAGLLRTLAQLAFLEQTEETIEAAQKWLLANSDLSTAELFRTIQSWLPDRILIDKSPLYALTPGSMSRIQTHFPEARYLHLTRHPGDMMKSLLQLQQKLREPILERTARRRSLSWPRFNAERVENYWLQPNLAIVEFLESVPPEKQMRLRGEDLLSDPRTVVRQIAEWLGVRTDDEAIEAMLHPEKSPFASYGPANAKLGNDPHFLEEPALRPYAYSPRPLTWEPEPGRPVEVSEMVRVYAMQFGY
jgi:hypothetical protein